MKGIWRKEIRLMWANRILILVPLLVMILTTFAMREGTAWRESQRAIVSKYNDEDAQKRAKVLTEAQTHFEDYMQGGYYAAYYGSIRAALPPSPLSSVARGRSDVLPRVLLVNLTPDQAMVESEGAVNPLLAKTGAFDLAFVVVFLIPLLLIAVLHDAVTSDREGGRLALALSQPVSPGKLLAGALLVRAALVLVPLLLSILCLVPKATGWMAIPMVAISYCFFWVALCAWVVSWARSSVASAATLGITWVLIVMAAPVAISTWARSQHAVPIPIEAAVVRNETNDRLHEHWKENDEIFRPLYTDRPDLIPAGVIVTKDRIKDPADHDREMRVPTAISYAMLKASEPLDVRSRNEAMKQDALAAQFGRWLPSTAAFDAFEATSGNGADRYRQFEDQVARFRRVWENFYFRFIFHGEKMTVRDYERLPVFSFVEPTRPFPSASIGLSLGFAVLLSGAAMLRMRRLTPNL